MGQFRTDSSESTTFIEVALMSVREVFQLQLMCRLIQVLWQNCHVVLMPARWSSHGSLPNKTHWSTDSGETVMCVNFALIHLSLSHLSKWH